MNTKDKRPYKKIRLTDRHVPTWVVQGGPVHIAAFWNSESDAMYRCKELNDVHEAAQSYAIAELDKAQQTAAGLTVDEVDQCMDEVGDPPDNPDHFWQWREKVSARLTAAMEAKASKS